MALQATSHYDKWQQKITAVKPIESLELEIYPTPYFFFGLLNKVHK
jgi:hypothetical protein